MPLHRHNLTATLTIQEATLLEFPVRILGHLVADKSTLKHLYLGLQTLILQLLPKVLFIEHLGLDVQVLYLALEQLILSLNFLNLQFLLRHRILKLAR